MITNDFCSITSIEIEDFYSLYIVSILMIRFRMKSLAPLLQLTRLRSLCLNDREKNLSNPLCCSSSYQQDVKNNLPNLGKVLISLSLS